MSTVSCDLIANLPLPLSRTTKVFPNHQTTRQSGCLECFAEVGVSRAATPIDQQPRPLQALPVILRGLEVPVHKETLHSGVRQYLHRMIICLGDELLKYVPMAITLLLKDCQVSCTCSYFRNVYIFTKQSLIITSFYL